MTTTKAELAKIADEKLGATEEYRPSLRDIIRAIQKGVINEDEAFYKFLDFFDSRALLERVLAEMPPLPTLQHYSAKAYKSEVQAVIKNILGEL